MAGLPYVPLYVVFPRGKEAIALRVALQKPRAWSYVAEMWCGVAQFAANGRVEGPAAVHQLEDWAGWDGAPGAFVEALCLPHIGLLDITERGFYVHNWHVHCGLHIEKRKKDRERKKAKRSAERPRNVRGQKKDVRSNSTDELEQEKEQEQEQRTTQEEAAPIADLAPRPVSPLVAFLRETYPDITDPWKAEAAWLKAYPRVDLLAEAIKARAWEVSNPKNAKSHHARFLNAWFGRVKLPPLAPEPPPLPTLDAAWLGALPPEKRARAEERWAATVERLKRAAYPDALPRLLAAEAASFADGFELMEDFA